MLLLYGHGYPRFIVRLTRLNVIFVVLNTPCIIFFSFFDRTSVLPWIGLGAYMVALYGFFLVLARRIADVPYCKALEARMELLCPECEHPICRLDSEARMVQCPECGYAASPTTVFDAWMKLPRFRRVYRRMHPDG